MVVAGYYKKALMAVCLCIALFAGNGSVRGQGPGIGDQKKVGAYCNTPVLRSQKSEVRSQEFCEERFEPQKRAHSSSCSKSGTAGLASESENSELPYGRRLSAACCGELQYFNDFIVYLKDGRKPVCRDEHGTGRKDRILVCDVVIELNRGMKLLQERTELRKIIYNTLKEPSDLYEIKRSLKEKIKIGLNNFMSDEIIKNVYFTKFILL